MGAGWYVTITRVHDGLHFQVANEARFPLTATSKTEFWAETCSGAIRFERDDEGVGSTIGYRNFSAQRVEPFDAESLDFSKFTGEFESEELDTRYTILVRDGALVATHRRHGDVALTPAYKDEFVGNKWFFSPVTFVRNEAGIIKEILVGRGRARNLRFQKVME